jgi:hypothetical protein
MTGTPDGPRCTDNRVKREIPVIFILYKGPGSPPRDSGSNNDDTPPASLAPLPRGRGEGRDLSPFGPDDGQGEEDAEMGSFLQEMFLRFGGVFVSWNGDDEADRSCLGALTEAVEHVVDQTHGRLRLLPGYSRRLREPIAATFRYIDDLVERVPGAMLCCRSTFSDDPRVSAFFVDPPHLQEVFSQNRLVRDLLENNPHTDECWALLCMKKEERQHLGVSLVGDSVHREVMQTAVSFTDHQVLAPGGSEAEARVALKCCIFNGLLAYVKNRASESKTRAMTLESRRKSLRTRLSQAGTEGDGASRAELERKIALVEREIAQGVPRLTSLEDYLEFVADVLGNPQQYLNGCSSSIRLSRLGIKLEGGRTDAGNEIPLFLFRLASHTPRVGSLVRFPRAELLPPQDFVRRADLFLTL